VSGVRERLWLPTGAQVKGSGKIELFDERGKLQERVPFENFIAPPGMVRIQNRTRSALQGSLPTLQNEFTFADRVPIDTFTHVVLTDDDSEEDPENERFWKGNLIGWSNQTQFAGADVYRGTPNAAESVATPESVTWVFDWPTHAAIGEIASVCFVGIGIETDTSTSPPVLSSPIWIDRWKVISPPPGYWHRGIGQGLVRAHGIIVLWASSSGPDIIQRFDPTDLSEIETLQIVDTSNADQHTGICYDGTNYFSVRGADGGALKSFVRIDGTTGAVTTLGSTLGSSLSSTRWNLGLSPDGDELLLWTSHDNFGLRRYLKSDGSLIGTISGPGPLPQRIASDYDNGVVWFGAVPYDLTTWTPIVSTWGRLGTVYWNSASQVGFNTSLTPDGVYCGNGEFGGVSDSASQVSGGPWGSAAEADKLLFVGRRAGLGSRALLPSPVTKTALQTLKLTYTFSFVEPEE